MELNWKYIAFDLLSPAELYEIMYLRSEVFVVEQNCVYLDPDGNDKHAFHLMGYTPDGILAAYCRILPPDITYPEASIGRVVTSPKFRAKGFAIEMMKRAIQITLTQFNVDVIQIGAQSYLKKFYTSLGFKAIGEEYLEDGIPHIHMLHMRHG